MKRAINNEVRLSPGSFCCASNHESSIQQTKTTAAKIIQLQENAILTSGMSGVGLGLNAGCLFTYHSQCQSKTWHLLSMDQASLRQSEQKLIFNDQDLQNSEIGNSLRDNHKNAEPNIPVTTIHKKFSRDELQKMIISFDTEMN